MDTIIRIPSARAQASLKCVSNWGYINIEQVNGLSQNVFLMAGRSHSYKYFGDRVLCKNSLSYVCILTLLCADSVSQYSL